MAISLSNNGDYTDFLSFSLMPSSFIPEDWYRPYIKVPDDYGDSPGYNVTLMVYRYPLIIRGTNIVNTRYTYNLVDYTTRLSGYKYVFYTYLGLLGAYLPWHSGISGGWTLSDWNSWFGYTNTANRVDISFRYNYLIDYLKDYHYGYTGTISTDSYLSSKSASQIDNGGECFWWVSTYDLDSVFTGIKPTDESLGRNPKTESLFLDLPEYRTIALPDTGVNRVIRSSVYNDLMTIFPTSQYELGDYNMQIRLRYLKDLSFDNLICRPWYMFVTCMSGSDLIRKGSTSYSTLFNKRSASTIAITYVGVEPV